MASEHETAIKDLYLIHMSVDSSTGEADMVYEPIAGFSLLPQSEGQALVYDPATQELILQRSSVQVDGGVKSDYPAYALRHDQQDPLFLYLDKQYREREFRQLVRRQYKAP